MPFPLPMDANTGEWIQSRRPGRVKPPVPKLLTVIRHANSGPHRPGTNDFDRPLDRRGQRDALEMGRRLAELPDPPSVLVASPAQRAAETAKTIAASFEPEPEIVWDRALYLAGADTLLDTLFGLDPAHTHAALVGHNPGITGFVNCMANAGIEDVPSCGVIRLQLAIDDWRLARPMRASLIDFDYPKRR